jgi:hypothetical protein
MNYIGNYEFLHQPMDQMQQIAVPWNNDFTKICPVQLKPGELLNMVEHERSSDIKKKYWAAITDYVPGHVFVDGDEMISDFKAGDVYEFENINNVKGAANISLIDFKFIEIVEYIK